MLVATSTLYRQGQQYSEHPDFRSCFHDFSPPLMLSIEPGCGTGGRTSGWKVADQGDAGGHSRPGK